MIEYFSYDRLLGIVNKVSPYRGTTNRFPLLGRKDNTRYFLIREENNQLMFDVCYGYRWTRESDSDQWNKSYNVIGIVRPDGSFQFTADRLGQGVRSHFITPLVRGNLYTSSRRGGSIYVVKEQMYPICEYMYFDGGFVPLGDIVVSVKTVNRKLSREYINQWETFFKVSETMVATLSNGTLAESSSWCSLVKDIHEEYVKPLIRNDNNYWKEAENRNKLLKAKAKEIMNQHPVDAAILFSFVQDAGVMQGIVQDRIYYYGRTKTPMDLYQSMLRRLRQDLYLDNPDIFKTTHYEKGVVFPESIWGIDVTIDGKSMAQYTD